MNDGDARVSTSAHDLAARLDPLQTAGAVTVLPETASGARNADLARTYGVSWTTIHREQQRAGL